MFSLLAIFLSLVSARTILDLQADVQASVPYNQITLLCAQCALAGNENSGCWGSSEESAVLASGCSDGSIGCFCAEAAKEDREAYILSLAKKICLKAGTSRSSSESLAVWAYGEFCNITVAILANSSSPANSSNPTEAATTGPSRTTTPEPQPDPLHPVEIFGIVFAAVIGFLTFLVAVWQCVYSHRGGKGFALLRFMCGSH